MELMSQLFGKRMLVANATGARLSMRYRSQYPYVCQKRGAKVRLGQLFVRGQADSGWVGAYR